MGHEGYCYVSEGKGLSEQWGGVGGGCIGDGDAAVEGRPYVGSNGLRREKFAGAATVVK